MKKLAIIAGVGLVVGFLAGVGFVTRPGPVTVRASSSLAWFLVLVLLALCVVGAGVLIAPGWLRRRKRRTQLEDAQRMAEVYQALSGGSPQRTAARRPVQQPGAAVYIVGGAQSDSKVDDLARALGVDR